MRSFAILVSLTLLAGCATQRATTRPGADAPATRAGASEPRSRSGNQAFYEVFGKRYHVLASSDGYKERGVASWYGKKFHGRPTASGEIYDMHTLTAAHKSLPLPSTARVTNLKNKRSVIVRINDRGPFVNNRLIDLSFAAAQTLDLVGPGTGLVEVEVISGPTPLATSAPAQDLFVQVGAFGVADNAERQRAQLQALGFDATIRQAVLAGQPVHRVQVGPVDSVSHFDALVDRLRSAGFTNTHLAPD